MSDVDFDLPTLFHEVITHPAVSIAFYTVIFLSILYVILFSVWLSYQKKELKKLSETGVLLEVRIERDAETDRFGNEQMWSNFYSILYVPWVKRLFKPQPHITFELKSEYTKSKVAPNSKKTKNDTIKEISFNFWVPEEYVEMIKSRILALYPKTQFHEVADYIPDKDDAFRLIHTEEIGLTNDSTFPIRLLQDYKVDPLSSIMSSMSNLANMELVVLQIVARPMSNRWNKRAERVVTKYQKNGRMPAKLPEWMNIFTYFFSSFFRFTDSLLSTALGSKVPETILDKSGNVLDKMNQNEMIEKITRNPFAFQIRVLAASSMGKEAAKDRTRSVIAALKELDGTYNSFEKEYFVRKDKIYDRMKSRYLSPINNDDVLTSVELAGFAHFPNKTNQTAYVKTIGSRFSEVPIDVSTDFPFAYGINVDGKQTRIGLDEKGRMRHIYISGMTGVGKSTIMENMIFQDIEEGRSCIVLDPHGELVDAIANKVSAVNRDDIFILNPSDMEHPFGMNLLELTSADPVQREMEKVKVVDAYITAMKRVFGEASIGASTDDIFRMSCSAILEDPQGGGLLEMLLMITSEPYRRRVIQYVTNPVVKNYWEVVYPALAGQGKFLVQNLNAPLNKIRRFIANELVSNIICQKRSTISIADTMNNGGVILARFSRGDMGFENSALLGTMLVAKVQIAAMQRVGTPEDQIIPTYLYVDEFQNFVGDAGGSKSFAEILSEARKYKLGLIIANQFIAQLTQAGGNFLLDAIFNNCGTTITFRVGAIDAKFYETVYYDDELKTGYKKSDLIELGMGEVVMQLMTTKGNRSKPFMAKTFMPLTASKDANRDILINRSREIINIPRSEVSKSIQERMAYDTIDSDFT